MISLVAVANLQLRRRRHPMASIAARVRAPWLDRQLAAGIAPWHSPSHAARAVQITSDRRRRSLARALERLVDRAEQPPTPFRGAAIPPCSEQVRHALPMILTIAARLRDNAPVDVRAMAQLHSLLCDGAGPCYTRIVEDALTVALEEISQRLSVDD